MAVDQTKVIDFVGVDKSTGEVVLTIADHMEWKNSENHQLILQAKINSYLAFIESGEIFESYPDSRGRQPVISILGQFLPDTQGHEFLSKVKAAVEDAGIGFRFALFAPGPQ